MPDFTREAVARFVESHALYRNTIGKVLCTACRGRHWDDFDGYAAHLVDALLSEYLVVPRSEIAGTEYGWRHLWKGRQCEHVSASFAEARRLAEANDVPILQRPVLPWSVIQTAEDGE